MQDANLRFTYFENMSVAFARMCDVSATVMDKDNVSKKDGPEKVNCSGIWYGTEFKELRLMKKVHFIEAISPDGNLFIKYWTRDNLMVTRKGMAVLFKDEVDGGSDEVRADKSLMKRDSEVGDDDEQEWHWWDDDVLSEEELEDWGVEQD